MSQQILQKISAVKLTPVAVIVAVLLIVPPVGLLLWIEFFRLLRYLEARLP